jgi:hypothetical protein
MASHKKYFFYCQEYGDPEHAAYQHPTIVIAEGLRELGIPFYSDKNYWKLSPDSGEHLFVYDPNVSADDCDVVVVNSAWMQYGGSLPANLFHPGRRYKTVYVDDDDGLHTHSMTPLFRSFDLILRTHCNRRHTYPANVRPWQFGPSQRMIDALSPALPYTERTGGALYNFRARHQLRDFVRERLLPFFQELMPIDERIDASLPADASPAEKILWEQTGRRHTPGYFERLRNARACFTFGGYFSSPFPRTATSPLLRKMHALVTRLNLKTGTLIQYDSWRLWESLVAGCVTIHVDFDKYGIMLPVMPENWKHYIGVDLGDIEGSIAKIRANLPHFAEIARAGREWALANYSPKVVAERFMGLI